jgi:hypothetical protein
MAYLRRRIVERDVMVAFVRSRHNQLSAKWNGSSGASILQDVYFEILHLEKAVVITLCPLGRHVRTVSYILSRSMRFTLDLVSTDERSFCQSSPYQAAYERLAANANNQLAIMAS